MERKLHDENFYHTFTCAAFPGMLQVEVTDVTLGVFK